MVPDRQHRRRPAEQAGAAQRHLLRPVHHQGKGRVLELQQRQHAEVAVLHQGQPQAPGDPRGGPGLGRVVAGQERRRLLAQHRHDTDIAGLQSYFASVIDWIGSVFIRPPDKEMRGLEWGRLYEAYHSNAYNAAEIDKAVDGLRADEAVKSAKGIYEYFSVAGLPRGCSTFGCSTTRPSAPDTSSRPRRPKPQASRPTPTPHSSGCGRSSTARRPPASCTAAR